MADAGARRDDLLIVDAAAADALERRDVLGRLVVPALAVDVPPGAPRLAGVGDEDRVAPAARRVHDALLLEGGGDVDVGEGREREGLGRHGRWRGEAVGREVRHREVRRERPRELLVLVAAEDVRLAIDCAQERGSESAWSSRTRSTWERAALTHRSGRRHGSPSAT